MGASRKYSDAQRAAMFALYEQGLDAAEISRRCKAGLASVAPFEIPRRSVAYIVTSMAKERELPNTLDEAAVAVTEGRFRERVYTLLNEQLTRLEAKQGPLSAAELGRAEQVEQIGTGLERRLRRRKGAELSNGQRNGAKEPPALSPLEELARKQRTEDAERVDEPPAQADTEESPDESEQAQDAFTHAHACLDGEPSAQNGRRLGRAR